jgi:hypothetical protein
MSGPAAETLPFPFMLNVSRKSTWKELFCRHAKPRRLLPRRCFCLKRERRHGQKCSPGARLFGVSRPFAIETFRSKAPNGWIDCNAMTRTRVLARDEFSQSLVFVPDRAEAGSPTFPIIQTRLLVLSKLARCRRSSPANAAPSSGFPPDAFRSQALDHLRSRVGARLGKE